MLSGNLFKKLKIKFFFLPILFAVSFIFTGFLSLYQSGNIKKDYSGTFNIVYSGTIKHVEDNGYIIGNYPFGDKNIRDYFSSDDVIIKKLQIAKPGDTAYMVILDLEFKNLTDLNNLKAFSDMNVMLTKADKGTEIKWVINSNERTKLLNVLNFNLKFENELLSSDGVMHEGLVKWQKTDFSKNNVLSVVLKSDLPISENKNTGKSDEGNNDDKENNSEGKKKICGLWGLELPMILLAGFIFYFNKRRT